MPELVRTLRLRDLLLLFIGSVIGSGIFLTPGLIFRQLDGSVGLSLLVWLVGGVLSLLGALTYAELAACNPEAGGLYCFIRDGFGRLPAFLYGWCLFLVIASGSVAALARAFSRYLSEIIPLSLLASTIVAVVMIAVVTVVNIWGTRKSADLQNWTTLVKVAIIVVLSMVLLARGHHAGEIPLAMGTTQHGVALFSNFGLAMIAVLWAYEGWQFGTYSAGEVLDPQRNFPRAFLSGSLLLAGLYMIAVLAYLVALGPAGATASEAIAATAVGEVFGSWAGKLVAPAFAIVALGVWSAVLTCAGKFSELIGGVIFVGWIFYGLGAAAIFPIRRASAGRPIPYRVPGYPWTPLIFVLAAAAIVGNAIYLAFRDPSQFKNLAVAILLFFIGLPAYFFWRKRAAG